MSLSDQRQTYVVSDGLDNRQKYKGRKRVDKHAQPLDMVLGNLPLGLGNLETGGKGTQSNEHKARSDSMGYGGNWKPRTVPEDVEKVC